MSKLKGSIPQNTHNSAYDKIHETVKHDSAKKNNGQSVEKLPKTLRGDKAESGLKSKLEQY